MDQVEVCAGDAVTPHRGTDGIADPFDGVDPVADVETDETPADGSGPACELPDDAAEFQISAAQCLLFAAGRAVLPEEVARALQVDLERAESLLSILQRRFEPGGLQVVSVAGGYQMTTRPEYASVLSRFLEPPPQRLSQPALETAALIAYRQPLTLPEIEAVRGVKSDSSVRTLLERGLIEDAGRKEVVGRPILYRTTPAFLVYLGINSLSELPPLETEADEGPAPGGSAADDRAASGAGSGAAPGAGSRAASGEAVEDAGKEAGGGTGR